VPVLPTFDDREIGSDEPISRGWADRIVSTSILVAGGSGFGLPAMVRRTDLEAEVVLARTRSLSSTKLAGSAAVRGLG